MPLPELDGPWGEEEELVQDPRFARWEEAPEPSWEEDSLDQLPPPPPSFVRADDTVYVATGPVDDTFEQAILASGIGAVVVAGMCLASAFLGFLIGLVVAA
jgi:hypothetical protein